MDAAEEVEGSTDESENSPGPVLVDLANRRVTGPKRRSTVGGWTQELDTLLIDAYDRCNGKPWKKIAESVPGKTDVQCLHRYQKVLHPFVHKGPWTQVEDNLLCGLVERLGDKKWSEIAKDLPGRIGKQCRERWNNHLKPSIDRSPWRREEDSIIMRAHHENGNKWAVIAKLLPGRTENSIKNRWNCSLKKKLVRWGNPQRLDEQLTFEGYPVTPLHKYERNEDVENGSSEMLQNKEKTPDGPDKVRIDSSHGSARPEQTGTSGYFPSSLGSVTRPAGQEPRELHGNLHGFPDRGFHSESTDLMDNYRNLVDNNSGSKHSFLTTPASQELSLASPVNQSEFLSTSAGSPEAILRSKATSYKYTPSIIRKRRIEESPDTAPCNKSRKVEENGVKLACGQQIDIEDEAVSTELSLSPPSQSLKLEGHIGRNRPVEKSLGREFDAVWDSSGKR